jgi:hypothetical protein
LVSWNTAPAPPVRLSDALRRDIRARLSDEVGHLSGLIGRDLGHWLDGIPTGRPRAVAEPVVECDYGARGYGELELTG